MRRIIPALILAAAVLIDTLLCGFATGAIMISTGVSFYQGWAGVTVSDVTVVTQVALAGGPTYLPPPTYTVLPSYTPYPTYTLQAAALELQAATPSPQDNLDAAVTLTATLTPGANGQEVTYVVQEGDTLESIAAAFAVDPADIVNANGLSPENPMINVGDVLVIPVTAQVTVTTPAPTLTLPAGTATNPVATSPAGQATATPSPTATTSGQYPLPTQTNSSYPNPTAPYP
jgi:LysM repeat protein